MTVPSADEQQAQDIHAVTERFDGTVHRGAVAARLDGNWKLTDGVPGADDGGNCLCMEVDERSGREDLERPAADHLQSRRRVVDALAYEDPSHVREEPHPHTPHPRDTSIR